MKVLPLALLLPVLLTGCVTKYRLDPIENPPATVRYDRGQPTTSLVQRNGAIQITPLAANSDGKLAFAVAAFNDSDAPSNFGVENIEVDTEDKHLRVYTVDDLIRQARNRAIAASVAVALIGAVGAAASHAAAHQTYHSSYSTPHGTYVYRASYFNASQAAAGTAASIDAASAGIYAINQTLDATIANMGESVLQTTTVDPGYSVGGRVLVSHPRSRRLPQQVSFTVRWMDERYPFLFELSDARAKRTRQVPAQTPAAPEERGSKESGHPSGWDPPNDRDLATEDASSLEKEPATQRIRTKVTRTATAPPQPHAQPASVTTTTVPEGYLYPPSFLETP